MLLSTFVGPSKQLTDDGETLKVLCVRVPDREAIMLRSYITARIGTKKGISMVYFFVGLFVWLFWSRKF